MCVTYDFYIEKYLQGKSAVIANNEFNYYCRKAINIIKQYTFGKIPDAVPECLQMCCYEVAELICNFDKNSNNGITSESVGDLHYTYENTGNKQNS